MGFWKDDRKVEVYKAKDGHRWRRKMRRGGKIVAESGEAYARPSGAMKAAERENPGIEVVSE